MGLQVCPTYVAHCPEEEAFERALEQVEAFERALGDHAGEVVSVRSSSDLDGIGADGRVGLMLSMEGMEPLGGDPTRIDAFWDRGVRMCSLTWNKRNEFAAGAAEVEDGGLTPAGTRLLERMLDLGIAVDLAHASQRTFWDVIDRMNGTPVIVSHGACRSICDSPRNLSDEQLEAIAATGGVLGVMLVPFAIDPDRREIGRAVDHIEHARSVMGSRRVGLGGDFMRQIARATGLGLGADSLLPDGIPLEASLDGLAGPEDYPRLVDALKQRGLQGSELADLLGGNFLRVLRSVLP